MKIAVIGSGISGLTFAAGIKSKSLSNIQIELYERDLSSFSRPQGYAIGLKAVPGLAVFTKLGLLEKLLAANCAKVANFVVNTQNGRELFSSALLGGNENSIVYRVQRDHIRDVLREAASGIPIHYGFQAVSYERENDGITVFFANGKKITADYVIACDGSSSAIRLQMVGDKKHFLGLTTIFGLTSESIDHPLLDGGYFMTLGNDGTSFFSYRQPGGIYFSYTVHTKNTSIMATQTKEQLLQHVQNKTKNWSELIKKIVRTANSDSIGVRGCYDKEPLSTLYKEGVWLIGDAAHPMCPFRGEGANIALVDALNLAEFFTTLARGEATTQQEISLLEADMIARGRKAILASRQAAKQFHKQNKLKQLIRNAGFRLMNFVLEKVSSANI
jgi:2-polyprenyl-6-methoxyphenol hydroxylase-like FAD-dependent oxidoreductase